MSEIDVLLITALKEEHDAARDVALGATGKGVGVAKWDERDANTATPYLLGKYVASGGRSMNVALARPTRMGATAMSPIAASLVERLKPRCLAMCGVCAGNPGDVALGDVIIAEMVYTHDEGKQNQGAFEGDHRQAPMQDIWVRAAQDLLPDDLPSFGPASVKESQNWVLERLYVEDDPIRHPARARYFPERTWGDRIKALESDGLVRRNGSTLVLTDQGRAFVEEVLFYDPDGPQKLPFQIKVGPIASGNVVVKDGVTWENLKKWGVRSVLGLEMEAAAIGSTALRLGVPAWVVVKGVMDHANPRKDDRYKPFAARASAEVLFKFLLNHAASTKIEAVDSRILLTIEDHPFSSFLTEFREIVRPFRYAPTNAVINLAFGNLSHVREAVPVLPINQSFDFEQRGPRSVLAAFETITIEGLPFYEALEQLWPAHARPRAAGLGATHYLPLPENSMGFPGVMFAVTTRNLSTKSTDYGYYVNTPLEGIDLVLQSVLDRASRESISELALPLLGSGYANIQRGIDQTTLSCAVLGLTIVKTGEALSASTSALQRVVVVAYSNDPQGKAEHVMWEFVVKLLAVRTEQRADWLRNWCTEKGW